MNTETLSGIRDKLTKIDALYAEGTPFESACAAHDISPRTYRRWREVVEFYAPTAWNTGEADIAALAPELEAAFGRHAFEPGTTLFRRGDFADHMYLVLTGTVFIPELDAFVGPGELVGEIGVFSEAHRRTATAVCSEDCALIRIPLEAAFEIARTSPAAGLSIARTIAERSTRNAERAAA